MPLSRIMAPLALLTLVAALCACEASSDGAPPPLTQRVRPAASAPPAVTQVARPVAVSWAVAEVSQNYAYFDGSRAGGLGFFVAMTDGEQLFVRAAGSAQARIEEYRRRFMAAQHHDGTIRTQQAAPASFRAMTLEALASEHRLLSDERVAALGQEVARLGGAEFHTMVVDIEHVEYVSDGRTIVCADIVEIGELAATTGGSSGVFNIAMKQGSLSVFSNLRIPEHAALLAKKREDIAACRRRAGTMHVSHQWFQQAIYTTKGVYAGWCTNFDMVQ